MHMKGNSAATILRWGLAFVFFYAAVEALLHPDVWVGYMPLFLTNNFSPKLLLSGFSVFELVLAIWLFWGRKLMWSSMIAAITLAVITLLNTDIFLITFRDVGLAMAALALFELAREKNFKEEEIE
jgi:uncharacterized membrane protein YphA (DoxX/SURF4 family)